MQSGEVPWVRPGTHTAAAEAAVLDLVRDIQRELAQCLNSLGGKPITGPIDRFIGFSCRHVNNAVYGYVLLRSQNQIDASKLLIRPIIEFWFRLRAVLERPDVFYRIIVGERKHRTAWLRAWERMDGPKFDAEDEQADWERFESYCKSEIPNCDLTPEPLSVESIAQAARLQKYYDAHYRLYCMFTHGHLEAVLGGFDPLSDSEDNLIVALSGLAAIASAMTLGGEAENFDAVSARLVRLSQPPTD